MTKQTVLVWPHDWDDRPCLQEATLVVPPPVNLPGQDAVTLVCTYPKGHDGPHGTTAREWTTPAPTTAGVRVRAGVSGSR